MRMGPAAVLVAAGVLATAGSAAADLSVVSPSALSVHFVNGVAPVTVTVSNSGTKAANLVIRYVGKGQSVPVTHVVKGPLSLIRRNGLKVAPNRVATITLSFHRKAGKPAINGVLVIRGGGS